MRIRRAMMVTPWALMLVMGMTACQPDRGKVDPATGTAKACDTQVEAPKTEMKDGHLMVVGQSVSHCDTPPSRHVANVSLKHFEGGKWEPKRGPDGNWFRMCEAIPYPGSDVRCEWAVPCEKGKWRVEVTVTGTMRGKDFSFPVPEKPEAKISC